MRSVDVPQTVELVPLGRCSPGSGQFNGLLRGKGFWVKAALALHIQVSRKPLEKLQGTKQQRKFTAEDIQQFSSSIGTSCIWTARPSTRHAGSV
ncbi:hypothetical protein AOLI_G00272280 [Acnodon oligacanthus]